MPVWLSVLPPLLAIAIAIWKKEVIVALVLGIWVGEALYLWHSGAISPHDGLAFPLLLLGRGFWR